MKTFLIVLSAIILAVLLIGIVLFYDPGMLIIGILILTNTIKASTWLGIVLTILGGLNVIFGFIAMCTAAYEKK